MMNIQITYGNRLKLWLMPPMHYWRLQMFMIDTSVGLAFE